MVSESTARRAVRDALHRHFGFSENLLVEFILGEADSSSSKSDFFRRINDPQQSSLFEDSTNSINNMKSFIDDIWIELDKMEQTGRVRKKASKYEDDYEKALKSINQEKKIKSYKMIYDNEDFEDNNSKQLKNIKDKSSTKKSLKKQIVQDLNNDTELSDNDMNNYSDSGDALTNSKSLDHQLEFESLVQDEIDQEEMIEFSKRLAEKDSQKTKKIIEESNSLNNDKYKVEKKTNSIDIDKLREKSRFNYLKKRQAYKVEDLELELNDEENLFHNEKLTDREKYSHKYKQRILDLAKDFKSSRDTQKVNRYFVPKNEKIDDKFLITDEDKEVQSSFESGSMQKKWEEQHMKNASVSSGSKDAIEAAKKNSKQNEYEMLLGDEVEFVQTLTILGSEKNDSTDKYNVLKNLNVEESNSDLTEFEKKTIQIAETRRSLPIFSFRQDLIDSILEHQVLIIEGETGSGKTTQIAQYLYESGYCKNRMRIGITQPRRVAAMSVAARVSQEMGVKLGHEVGYSIRFEDCTTERTVIKYMTDGMLLREFLTEPDLASYSVIIIDEAHERTLHTDILFGLIKDLVRFKPEMRVIISSATLDAVKFSDFFDGAPIFKIPGRRFPVDIFYTKSPEADYIESAIITILQIHLTQKEGDILCFLSGQEEIMQTVDRLNEKVRKLGSQIKQLIILPVYSALPSDMQSKIFEKPPKGARKVVIATNIAETSLTIEGIKYVVDSGFCKQKSFDARARLDLLTVVPVSKASADQRAGRSGRTSPGKCFRLYTSWAYQNELDASPTPEIQRTNLSSVVLMLKSLGIDDLLNFDFMDPPPHAAMIYALEQLYALGALNQLGQLTKLGRRMAEFPCDPMEGKFILASEQYGCLDEAITICAMLSASHSLYYTPKDKEVHANAVRLALSHPLGDHLSLYNVYQQWQESGYSVNWCFDHFVQYKAMKQARDIREQLSSLAERVEIAPSSCNGDFIKVQKAITAGFFYNTARRSSSSGSTGYKTLKQHQSVDIHPSSCLFESRPKWVIFHELVFTTQEYMRQNIEIEPKWLIEVAPHFYKTKEIEDDTLSKSSRTSTKSSRSKQSIISVGRSKY